MLPFISSSFFIHKQQSSMECYENGRSEQTAIAGTNGTASACMFGSTHTAYDRLMEQLLFESTTWRHPIDYLNNSIGRHDLVVHG